MKLLLDTHVAVWAIVDDPALPPGIREIIDDPANSVTVSVITLWEIAIKFPLAKSGHGEMPLAPGEALRYFREAGFSLLNVLPEHALTVETLPRLHRDPFDRMLVAQAMTEPLRLITHDPSVAAYSQSVIRF